MFYQLIRARQQGAENYWGYHHITECPFDDETEECIEWENGFYEARAIDNGDLK